jgi:DNA polymerase-3 subunit beta
MTKLTMTTADALRATRRLRWIAEKKSTLPVLGHAKVKAAKDGLVFTATDLESELQIMVPGDGEGELLLPLENFHKVFASTTGGVLIEKLGDKIKGNVGSFNVNYATLEVKDFPVMSPGKTPTAGFTAVADEFGWATQYPEHAMSTEETRPYLNGLFFHYGKAGLATVATDGLQLVRCNLGDDVLPLGNLKPSNFEGIIPRKTIITLNKLLLDIDPESGLRIAVKQYDGKNGRVVFAAADWKLTAKCVDRSFPDYHRVIPQSRADHRIAVDAALLEGATKAMKAADKSVRIEATASELLVSIKTDAAEALEMVEAEVSKPVTFGINAGHLLNALSNCGSKAVIDVYDAKSPVRISDPDQDDIIMVIMPMKAGDAPEISAPKALPKPKDGSTNAAAEPVAIAAKPSKQAAKKPAKAAKPAKHKKGKPEAQAAA